MVEPTAGTDPAGLDSLDIAVVGMAARFPGAPDLAAFWSNLVAGRCSVTRWDDDAAPAGDGERHVPAAYLIDGSDTFDAGFFGYSPAEAELMDPQHRVLLECAWAATEAAGLDLERQGAGCSVFAGAGQNTYLLHHVAAHPEVVAAMGDKQVLIGNRADFLTSRVSYKLGLGGPSVTVQTACSTSLVAVVQACQALLSFQCDAALAGGVAIDPLRHAGYTYSADGILSPDGVTRTFDARAQGTVGGDGVGVVVLKRLDDAIADRDHIHAVLKAGAINNDGALRAGFSAPSEDAQSAVILDALAAAGVGADTIGYVELHGTATNLGDPIELAALRTAFDGVPQGHCAVGSVKSNIGHLDAAAGVAGLIKTVLAVEAGVIPASLHFDRPNPRLALETSPFRVSTEATDWPDDDGPRRAGVSSFGLGGTNAHVIVEQAPQRERGPDHGAAELLVLSARTDASLQAATDRVHTQLRGDAADRMADVARTLQTRRAFELRRALVAASGREAVDVLDNPDDGRLLTARVPAGADRAVALVFPGFGSQHAGMARELYEQEPVFRAAVDECAAHAQPLLGQDVREILLRSDGAPTRRSLEDAGTPGDIDHPEIGYPAVFTFEYALAELWSSWSLTPVAMIGHSLGEYVAACRAGVFALPDALRLVIERARLMTRHGRGAMTAVPLTEAEVARYLDDDVSVAAVNDPQTCVLSGAAAAVAALEQRLDADDLVWRRLNSPYAFHSPLMAPVVDSYRALVAETELRAPRIPFVSNTTGTWITPEQAVDPDYWAQHLREPVRFAEGVGELSRLGDLVLLEVGPGQSLTSAAMQHPDVRDAGVLAVASLPDTQAAQAGRRALLRAAARMWLAGVRRPFPPSADARHVPLPTYPFERRRYWLAPGARDVGTAPRDDGAFTRRPDTEWLYAPTWRRETVAAGEPAATAGGRWLIFADDTGVAATLAASLVEDGATVELVTAGAEFVSAANGAAAPTWTIDPADPDGARRLMTALRELGRVPDRIVHCWNVDPAPAPLSATGVTELLRRGFHSVLAWAQAAESELTSGRMRVDVVAGEGASVLGTESVCGPKAATSGLVRVLQQEYPAARFVHHGVCPDGADVALLATAVRTSLLAPSTPPVVELRGRHRWIPGYDVSRPAWRGGAAVRPDGVYLITGGLGRIGLLVARALADSARVRLVLLGRTALPPRTEWDESQPPGTAATLAAVRDIEATGSTVQTVSADVADAGRMHTVLAAIVAEHGDLHGVVHAAGTTGEAAHRAASDLGVAEALWHFGPKVHGAEVLAEVLAGRRLDFALLCSSVAAQLGGLGFAAYAAANACLDTFAHARHSPDQPWCSVDWEAWNFGAASGTPGTAPDRRGLGAAVRELALTPQEGRELVGTLIASSLPPQVVVSTGDVNRRQRLWATPDIDVTTTERHERPSLSNPYVGAVTEAEKRVASIWQEILGVDRVGVHDNFFELGGSSLLGLQIVHRLRKQLDRAVPLTVIYEGPTVRTLAELLDGTAT